jgi:hypothetical protein
METNQINQYTYHKKSSFLRIPLPLYLKKLFMKEYIKLVISFFVVIMIIYSCGKTGDEKGKKKPSVKVEKGDEVEKEKEKRKKIVYGKPVQVLNSDKILIPVLAEYEGNGNILRSLKNESKDDKAFKVDYFPANFTRFDGRGLKNIIIYDLDSNKQHLLVDRDVNNIEVFFPVRKSDSASMNFCMFIINEKDTNEDGEIDNMDEDFVYISDLEGKNIVQISPGKIKLTGWDVNFKNDILIIDVIRDSDNDNKFTGNDDPDLLSISLSNPAITSGFIGDSLKVKIRNMYD